MPVAGATQGSVRGATPAPAPVLGKASRPPKRVQREGTEWFDADGVKLEPSDVLTQRQKSAEDDQRILSELPPHFAVFNERQ
ncbi:BAG family molecular chaperone regulator 5 [Alloscardovia macacae]|uniref:BAG family molecular chaperone regulator 5 n=1 Tax=Alloscardovia macacae TaxID=1160091 RepID=UPI0035AE3D6A